MKQDAQLALAVQLPDDETFTSFNGEGNQHVIAILSEFVEGKLDANSFYLFGLQGAGKSHLIHAACNLADENGLSSLCLSMTDLKDMSVDVLDGLEQIDVICVDDVQSISSSLQWQKAIFDLYNRVNEAGKRIIITGDAVINDLGLSLPDLKSRLSWGLIEQIKPLSDEEKVAAVKRRAAQRGLTVQDEAIRYLLNHYSREMAKLIDYLDTLDKLSIREQRKITIPFIKEALER
ncbi:DnaA regulatory inactivator Hda [Thalassotalea euphylliae]|uniref:DnaA regulatory inactivator Hda n=1 Tax=Thalassotalea euphylliae TaxID=1655234 RepID=UPI003632207F